VASGSRERRYGVVAIVLMTLSAAILFALGVLHLVYTFWDPRLTPRDPALKVRMSEVSPVISKETTMWRTWVGFNASHGMGAMLFGLVYGFWHLRRFSTPVACIGVSLACYVASIVVSRA
jgi:succinate dehydrogenase hydrophobic anchor subunit